MLSLFGKMRKFVLVWWHNTDTQTLRKIDIFYTIPISSQRLVASTVPVQLWCVEYSTLLYLPWYNIALLPHSVPRLRQIGTFRIPSQRLVACTISIQLWCVIYSIPCMYTIFVEKGFSVGFSWLSRESVGVRARVTVNVAASGVWEWMWGWVWGQTKASGRGHGWGNGEVVYEIAIREVGQCDCH